MLDNPEHYLWSSYRACIGQSIGPDWLAVDNVLAIFHTQRKKAIRLYQDYVQNGIDQAFSGKISQQTYLGDESFISQVQEHISQEQNDSLHITKRSKKLPKKASEEII